MILPIHPYGSSILREKTAPIKGGSPELQRLIDDMFETMHGASGIGLAAPQVGRTERVFVADLSPMIDDVREAGGEVPAYAEGPLVFINPEIIEADEDTECDYEEGCLSIPDIRETVSRPDVIRVRWLDREFNVHEEDVSGILARVVQHELDHLDGVLFVDHLSALRRRLLQRRLRAISRGEAEADYPLVSLEKAQAV